MRIPIPSRFLAFALLTALAALAASPALAHPPKALQVVAAFLELSEGQVGELVAIRTAANQATAPLLAQIAARREALGQIFAAGDPNPAEVGVLSIQIRALEHHVVAIQGQAAAEFRQLLDADQLDRLMAASGAQPLCGVLPAFQALHLI